MSRARLGGIILLVLLVAGLGGLGFLYLGPGPQAARGNATTVILQKGSGIGGVARSLKAAGVIRSQTLFMLMAKLTAGAKLKAGEYAIRSGESMAGVISDVKAGRVVRHFITIPEGWTSQMAADAVNAAPWLVGHAEPPPEGAILPDTYQVQRGDDRAKVIRRMEAARDVLLKTLWAHRAPDLPLKTPEEAVTLASIVEKETAIPAERPRIAAVFENRLKAGMRLESDPTVIYGVSGGVPLGRGISLGDLASGTPYNTYQIAGLPPTPIANPGRAALAAVLDPPQTRELYFVANGTGGHSFASTFEEHQTNVAHWREIEKQRAAAGPVQGAAR
ncbi:MAG TPA: endolytic transglycosylase MltG [Phenylobacterium sp.]|uniref:endolytic transglycosylase MltG n=1 Tax=Phenylobacterium sp. TaxID=1871053 RepID=UPI002BF1D848|nr:endolytic transglycosylase MltG [Phenylobacterium sp.]HSV03196.1 endolytic transglycosylase MltG [Phenylobacterium sp.]